MLIQFDVATRNAMLNAIEIAIGQGATLRIRTGAIPANTLAARTGTVVATIALPNDWLQDASGGSKAQAGTWSDASADAPGVATYFDIADSAGVTRWQGDVGLPGSNAFMIVDGVTFNTGQSFSISNFVLNAPNG